MSANRERRQDGAGEAETRPTAGDPLLLPLVLVVVGIVAGRMFFFSLQEAACGSAAFAGIYFLARRYASRLRLLSGCLAVLMAGVWLEAARRPGPPPRIDASSKELLLVEGCVVEPATFSEDRGRFTLELEPGARARVSLPVDPEIEPPRLDYGQRVEIEARLRPPRNYQNPGAFDNAGFQARREIFWTASMPRNASLKVLPGNCGSWWRGRIFALRTILLERIHRLYPNDAYASGMLSAFLIGDTTRLDREWTDSFRRTGSYHALVISGVHVSVLAGTLLLLLRLVPVSPSAALSLTALVAWIYAMVAGFSAPAIRAAGAFTLFLAARFFFRKTRVLNLLAAVALLYLAWDPEQIYEASFQLSFLAVAALGALAVPLVESTWGPIAFGMRNIGAVTLDPHLEPRVAQARVELRLAAETLSLYSGLPEGWAQEIFSHGVRIALVAWEVVLVSGVIQIGLALPLILYFHRVSLTGLSSNLFIVPAMNLLVPVGFLAVGTQWNWAAELSRWLLERSAKVAEWHVQYEFPDRLADPPWWIAVAFLASLLLVALVAGNRRARLPALALVLALFGVLLWQPWMPQVAAGQLEVTAIDVGQGDSLLVVFPQGSRMLVDGGGTLTYGKARPVRFDTGEDVVSPYLWTRGIRTLDVVVATHAHQDHSGGLRAILSNFHPKELWTGANPSPDLLLEAARLGIRVKPLRKAPPFSHSGAEVQVLAPEEDYASASPGNNDSLALHLRFGARAFLLTGDLEREIEEQMLAAGAVPHADVLKVGHHGSRTSSTEAFVAAVAPRLAVVSAGFENSFGHPHPDVLGRFHDRNVAILRTDLLGLATIRTDGVRLEFDVQQWHPPSLAKPPVLEGLLP